MLKATCTSAQGDRKSVYVRQALRQKSLFCRQQFSQSLENLESSLDDDEVELGEDGQPDNGQGEVEQEDGL